MSLKLDGPDPDVGAPRKVVDLPADITPPNWRHWADLAADGSRLLFFRQPGAQSARLDVVLNWYEELRSLPKP